MLQSATAVFISAMPMSFRVRSLFSSCFNVLHYILVNVSPDLSRLEAIFCFGRIWTDCSLQSYPLESFTVSWWSKIKKERSKKGLKQRSKNETKWQKEQPLQLAGFGSGRNACQRMCGYPNFHKLRKGMFPRETRVFYSVFLEEVFFRQKWFCDYKCVLFEKADREFYWK